MKFIRIFISGLTAWAVPFAFNTLLFPEIPLAVQFIIYLLIACIVIIEFGNAATGSYLRRRNKVTVQNGFAIGIIWLIIGFTGSALYYLVYKEMDLFEYLKSIATLNLMYPIIGISVGIIEEQRGRRK